MSFLNLFGGGDSTTSSTSTTENVNYNRQTADASGNQAVAFNGTLNGDFNYTNMDGQVAIHAMDNMLTSNQDSLLFASNAQQQAYGFGQNVLSFAQASNDSTMAFANASNQASAATSKAAIGTASDAMTKALQYGSTQTGVALDALAGSAQMIDTAYKDAKGVLGTNVIIVGMFATVAVLYFALRKPK